MHIVKSQSQQQQTTFLKYFLIKVWCDDLYEVSSLIIAPTYWVGFPPPTGCGHIDVSADPVCVGIGIGIDFAVGVTLSCLHIILWTSGWILIKFSWLYNGDITKNWLDFGDHDLIFLKTQLLVSLGGKK